MIALTAMLAGAGCKTSHDVTVHHVVDPIFITVDVNVKIQEEVQRSFDWEPDRSGEESSAPAPGA